MSAALGRPEQARTADGADLRIAALEAELAAVRTEMQAFTRTVSHDLRAPLRHIVSFAQLVQEDSGPNLSPEAQSFLATMTQSARHMGLQLDSLSALAQLGVAPVTLTPVGLKELVSELVADLVATTQQQHPARALEWRVAPDLPSVLADTRLLRQALQQVLANAVKFSAPREMALIEITADQQDAPSFVMLQVSDNGVGYNPAQQSALFKVFGRLHGAKQFDGLGMGLMLAAKAMQRMGGSVSAQGVVDGGCSVTLRLPSV